MAYIKKISLGVLCAIAIACVLCVYGVGGQIGAYMWNAAVFVLAPMAVLALLVQMVILTTMLCKRKRVTWNIIFIAVSIVFALPITVLVGISPITYPTNANPNDGITVVMPVENAVLFGGKEYKTHAMWPSECYAYDILAEPHDVGSENLNDYGVFGADVISPVFGTVIAMENSEQDIAPNTDEFISSLGNYIFLKIDETKTYLILAHLKQNSIEVSVGDHLDEGEFIGKVGNSGTTSEPHLHVQHQRTNPMDAVFPTCAEGLPINFKLQ